MLDFMFVHPSISGRKVNVRGVGLALFQAVCMIARSLKCPLVWGEATRDSSTFYERQLHRPVNDRFDIEDRLISTFAEELEEQRHMD